MARDQQVVDAHVDDQRQHRHPQRNLDRLHHAHRAQQHCRDGEEQVAEADDPQIGHALGHVFGLIGEDAQRTLGEDAHQGEQDQRQRDLQPHADGRDGANLPQPALAPVLAAQHDQRIADGVHQLLVHELNLVHRRHAGQRRLGIGAQHHVVRQIHAQNHGLLQHQRHAQPQKGPVKPTVLGKHCSFFLPFPRESLPQEYEICKRDGEMLNPEVDSQSWIML